MPSTILRTDNSGYIGGFKSTNAAAQTEKVFHYKYASLLNLPIPKP